MIERDAHLMIYLFLKLKDPLSCDYMINLMNNGIIFYFDAANQRLRV